MRATRKRRDDLKTSLIGWGAYIVLLTSYCSLYNPIVAGTPADVSGSFLYVLREWAIWWFLTPPVLKALRRNELDQVRWRVSYVQIGAVVLLVSVAFRVAVDLLTDARGTAAVIFIYMPRYLAVSIGLVLVWHFFLRRNHPSRSQDEYPASLLVDNGGATRPLRLEYIEFVSAAGKNVEIRSGNRDYTKRATMKELQDMLPPSQFVRVHRSYIVNIQEIDRISASRSGNDVIVLRGGRRINIGKKYRSQLLDSITRTL
jgi:hypothetical protein